MAVVIFRSYYSSNFQELPENP